MTSDREHRLCELLILDDRPGPFRFSPNRADTLVANALDAWAAIAIRSIPAPLPIRKTLLWAAAVFSLAGAAAALFYANQFEDQPSDSSTSNYRPPSNQDKAAGASPHQLSPTARKSPPDALNTVEKVASSASPTVANATARPFAGDPLQRANRFRQQRKWQAAEQTYRQVCTMYPGSASAYVALIAAAALRLDHLDNPRGALALFHQAVSYKPRGALDVEARLGIARSWQQLGEEQHELEALRALLQRYPSGPIAERARQRLEEIVAVNH